MDLKALKLQILSGFIASRVLLRLFMLAVALSIIPLLQILPGSEQALFHSVSPYECDAPSIFPGADFFAIRIVKPIWGSLECSEHVNLTTNVVRELMGMQMLDHSAKALCVGEGESHAVYALRELGFVNVCGGHRHSFFSLKHRKFVYELEYAENSFDFVFSEDLDKLSVPAMLVIEIERVLKPGGIGAMLVGVSDLYQNSLIKSVTPISSLLKTSRVVHVGFVQEFTLVVFKKRVYTVGYFEQFRLPADCQSVVNNRPVMDYLEPLMEDKQMGFEKKIAYLPKFIDVASKKQLVYIDIGVGGHLNSSASNWFLPSYPLDRKAFNVYLVDHNTSVLLSCVKKPGVTFIYYPGLAGDKATPKPDSDQDSNPYPYSEDEGFDFLGWFKETIQYADFVVLKMKAGEVELKFLDELFKSGTICFIDELFLSCSDSVDGKGASGGDCMDLFKSLRSSSVFVHQWWGD